MTDVAAPPPAANPRPEPRRQIASFLASDNLLARAAVLGLLTLLLLIPLSMIGSVIADRRTYEAEATKSVSEAWGGPQIFAGPTIVLPYRRADAAGVRLPEALARKAHDRRHASARAAPSRPVHRQRLQRHARRRGRVPDQPSCATWRRTAGIADWSAARLEVGLSDMRAIEGATVDVDGQRVDWTPGSGSMLSSLKAHLGTLALDGRETVSVRFSLAMAGSGKLGLVPLGRRTEATLSSPWPAPSFTGRSPAQPDRRQGRFSRPLVGVASRPAIRPALGQCQLEEPGA